MEELKLRPLRVSIFSWIFCVSSACFKILFVVPFILSCHQKCIAAVCNLVLRPFWSLSPMIVNKRDIVFIYFFCGTKFAFCFKECRWESYFSSRNAVGKTISGNQSFYLKECNWEKLFLIISHFSSGTAIGKIIVHVPNYVIQNPRNETSFSKCIFKLTQFKRGSTMKFAFRVGEYRRRRQETKRERIKRNLYIDALFDTTCRYMEK